MSDSANLERLLSALAYIPAEDRETWLHVGMALKHELGDDGFPHFDAWSEKSENYNARDVAAVWRSFREAGKVTAGTLYHYAKAHGWKSDLPPDPDRLKRQRLAAERAAVDAALRAKDRARAAALARTLWSAGGRVRAHPYLVRKQVSPSDTLRELSGETMRSLLGYTPKQGGVGLSGPVLLAPVKIAGALSTLELIDEAGRKSALRGGAKKGGYWASGALGATIAIGEGIATALTISAALAASAVASLSCTNLLPVAIYLRSRYPLARIMVCGDLGNGQRDAEKAALAVGGICVVPDFGPDRPDGATDFNDLQCLDGLEAVRRQLEDACS